VPPRAACKSAGVNGKTRNYLLRFRLKAREAEIPARALRSGRLIPVVIRSCNCFYATKNEKCTPAPPEEIFRLINALFMRVKVTLH
jgi:hypothetical protein